MAINSRYYFINALEMLDAESEYYIDREASLLYFILPGPAGVDFRGDAFISASGRHPEGWQPGTLKTDDSRVQGQQPPRSVPLRNAAAPGMTMPLAGLGMPCGPTYKCGQSSYEATLTFLALGGRHTDSADSYTGAEPGIGLAMREWMAADPATNTRADLFIASKIGPGGACWPLGYNESINQAKMIVGYYNALPSVAPTANITQLDLLLIHWPVNYGPCAINRPPGIPTTDPLCNAGAPTYDERACRVSTWRGMVEVWRMGLTRSIGVSNFNSTYSAKSFS